MADHSDEIAQLETALGIPGLPEAARRQLEIRLGDLRAQGSNVTLGNTVGRDLAQAAINLSDDTRLEGNLVGVNLGTVVYGRPPEEDERRKLVHYLERLANKLHHISLRGLDPKLDEQGASISLGKVYVELAIALKNMDDVIELMEDGKALPGFYDYLREDAPEDYYQLASKTIWSFLKKEYHPDWALPSKAVRSWSYGGDQQLSLGRFKLAVDACLSNAHSILLGGPGSGKSTFLRHIAWILARRGLGQTSEDTKLSGWFKNQTILPILLPLRKLAEKLSSNGINETAVFSAILTEIESYGIKEAEPLLFSSLNQHATLLLFDGLDEVPAETTSGIADRLVTLKAVHNFIRMYPGNRIIITCRTRAFEDQWRVSMQWSTHTLLPFTLGQIRHFVTAWYGELVASGQLGPDQAEKLSAELINVIVGNERLEEMAETPLLLTMMALVLYRSGTLPRDRPLLYERILELLLGQWDKLRDGQSLAEAIGQVDWDSRRIRNLLDELSYQAHAEARSEDGRGRLSRGALRDALIRFFEDARLLQPWESARRCLEYFDQRSGLLIPDDNHSYVFAHLTLQEHCAGCAMLRAIDAPARVLEHRADDRWREPLFLGLGVVQANNPALLERILTDLIDPDEVGRTKPAERRQRDLILAAEIGEDRDWNYMRTQQINVGRLQRDLRRGLAELLSDRSQRLPADERVRGGFLLGELGDPRFPVTLDEWRHEIERARAGDTGGYFCRVDAGTYIIANNDGFMREKPQHTVTFDKPFWIARFPITVAQGHAWSQPDVKVARRVSLPKLSQPNQPLVGLTWSLCNTFCTWLSEQTGATVRLPTEYEWEAAARGTDARRYPWGNNWDNDHAATVENTEQRGERGQFSVPVGSFAAGASPCGAHDMVGNVWEWTAGAWLSYPNAPETFAVFASHIIRGGSYLTTKTWTRCSARDYQHDSGNLYDKGLRVVLELG